MKVGDIDIPYDLIHAFRKGNVVVFAGAGISRNAGYDDFKQLAVNILHKKESELGAQIEVEFGNAKRSGVDVHFQVRSYFNATKPISLDNNKSITDLFVDHPIRIVTTNFDDLLSQAAGPVPEYYASALPDGTSSWNGIIYLHGKASNPSSQLVLTDEDFGNAYLIRRYCLRFLIDLFQNNHVLFVGYSMDDAIPQYLNRAMGYNATFKRWALCESSDVGKWTGLLCNPILFPQGGYNQLWDSLTQLGMFLSKGAKGIHDHWEMILKSPAHHVPAHDFDGFLLEFQQLIGLTHLLKEERDISWLIKISESGYLGWLTKPEIAPPNHDRQWMWNCAKWVSSYFKQDTFEELNVLLHNYRNDLHPFLVEHLTWVLADQKETNFSKEEEYRAFTWLQTKPVNQIASAWASLCVKLISRHSDSPIAWNFFKSLLQVRVVEKIDHINYNPLSQSSSTMVWQVGYDDEYHLPEAWRHIQPQAAREPIEAILFLESILRDYLSHVNFLFRPSIEPDGEFNYSSSGDSFLLDWIAELIQLLGPKGNRWLFIKCQSWIEESHIIFQRIGLYALFHTQATNVNTNARILYQSRLWKNSETRNETLPLLLAIGKESNGRYLAKFATRIRQLSSLKKRGDNWGKQIIRHLSILGSPWQEWSAQLTTQEPPDRVLLNENQQVLAIFKNSKSLLELSFEDFITVANAPESFEYEIPTRLSSRLFTESTANMNGALSRLKEILTCSDFTSRNAFVVLFTNFWREIDNTDDAERAIEIALEYTHAWSSNSRILSTNINEIFSKHPQLILSWRERILPWAIRQLHNIKIAAPIDEDFDYGDAINSEWGSWYTLINKFAFPENKQDALSEKWKFEIQETLPREDRSAVVARILTISHFPWYNYLDPQWTLKNIQPLFSINSFYVDRTYLIYTTWYDNLLENQQDWLLRITTDSALMRLEDVGKRFANWLMNSMIEWKHTIVRNFLLKTDTEQRTRFFLRIANGFRGLEEAESVVRLWEHSVQPIWSFALENRVLNNNEGAYLFHIIPYLRRTEDKDSALDLWLRTPKEEIADPFIDKVNSSWWKEWARTAEFICSIIDNSRTLELTHWSTKLPSLIQQNELSEAGWRKIYEALRIKGINF